MTHLFKKQSTNMMNPTTTTSGPLAMHRDSRVISKVQPKIRIIHIFAPEIIKTDAANFRELVQRLTGKPASDNASRGKTKDKIKDKDKNIKVLHNEAAAGGAATIGCNKSHHINTKLEVMMGSGSSSSPSSSSCDHHHTHDDDHHQEEAWRATCGGEHNNGTSGGFLTGFNDLDYNFDFNTMFHLGVADGSSNSINSLGESQLSYRG